VGTEQAGDQAPQCVADLDDQPPAVAAFLFEDRAGGSRDAVKHRNGLGIEADVGRAFEGDRADKAVAHKQRDRQDRNRAAALRQLGMRAGLVQFIGRGRVED
jgi:hypothetical protein